MLGVLSMQFVDLFCGVGGFTAGARRVATAVMGVDSDDSMVRLWAANAEARGVLADLWTDEARVPEARPDLHVHMSPPCTLLSKARRCRGGAPAKSLSGLDAALSFVRDGAYTSWSLETVSTPLTRSFMAQWQEQNPKFAMSWTVVDAADYGTPSTRVRIIAGNKQLVHELRQVPVSRLSVLEAFAQAGLEVPTEHIKNNTKTKTGQPCVRSVQGPSHTQTASHPLMWCDKHGNTQRCLSIAETAVVMGFPPTWMLPQHCRPAVRALGNAVPPALSYAIMSAAAQAAAKAKDG